MKQTRENRNKLFLATILTRFDQNFSPKNIFSWVLPSTLNFETLQVVSIAQQEHLLN